EDHALGLRGVRPPLDAPARPPAAGPGAAARGLAEDAGRARLLRPLPEGVDELIPTAIADRHLTENDVAAFERDGYVVRRGIFTPDEIARIAAWTDEVQHLPEVPGKYMMYFEPSLLEPGRRVLQRIENFSPYHAGFARLFDSAQMCGAVAQLF